MLRYILSFQHSHLRNLAVPSFVLLQILKRNSGIRGLGTQVKGTMKTQNHGSQTKTILFGSKKSLDNKAALDSFLKARVHRMTVEICPYIS